MAPLRVLLVEDSEADAALILRQLRQAGLKVEAHRVETVPELAEALARPWDAVLCDYSLTGFTAVDALAMVQERGLDLPFIIVSGAIGEETAVALMKAGAHDYLLKDNLTRLPAALEREVREAFLRAERNEAHLALRRNEERLRAVLEAVPELMMVIRKGRIVYINPTGVAELGYTSAQELVGQATFSLVAPEEHPRSRQRQAALELGEAVPPREVRLIRKDGSSVTLEVLGRPVHFDGTLSALVVGRDISERKRLMAKMMELDRLVAVGTLAAGVGHEINNPLTYVLVNLRFCAQELTKALPSAGSPGAHELQEALDQAVHGAERIRDIVAGLKTLARADEETVTAVDLERVLDSAIQLSSVEVRHRAQLVKELTPVPAVRGNESRLGQVFVNLLVNAAQAIPENMPGGVIVLRTGATRERVWVEVEDNGSGIAPEHLPRIFDPFFTTKPLGQGTGLGLAICHGIVQSLGGEMTVRSTLGKGTTFRLLLPIDPGEAPPADLPSPNPVEPASGAARVLFVDDEDGMAALARRMLGKSHDVTTVKSGREALTLLRAGEAFDVIICDAMMPDMAGADLYEALRHERPELLDRLVGMSGGAYTARARDFMQRVAFTLDKPFTADVLRSLLARVLAARPR